MLIKHKIATIVTLILSLILVAFLYKQNYLAPTQEIKFSIQQRPIKRLTRFVPDSMYTQDKSNRGLRLERITPPEKTIQPVEVKEKPRLFDDIMTATKTFTPLLSVLIPLYFHRKSKKEIAQTEINKNKVRNVNQKRRNRNS